MNHSRSFALTLLLSSLALGLLRADLSKDRRIESTAQASYNFHVVLQDRVTVKSDDGVVTLTGTVPDESQRALAENTVNLLPGVTRIDDQIAVEPPAPKNSDSWLAFKIGSLLLLKANVSSVNTQVAVKDGAVTLTGTAESMAQKELTSAYVKDVEGVKSVENDLAVKPPPAAAPPANSAIDDLSITAQIKYELFTHHSTSALETKVETHDGVVMISGAADSDAERDLVTRLAQDVRGVKSVNNTMAVKAATASQ